MDPKRIASLEQSRKSAVAGDHDLEHVGEIATRVMATVQRRRNMKILQGGQLDREVVGFRIEWFTRAAELAS